MIRDAVQERSSFNVIHLATMFKADVFIARRDQWSREELARARPERIRTAVGEVTIRFASPEDTVLHKLMWYKLGEHVSERQWSDIVGVLRIQEGSLDSAYLQRWAKSLNVADLLEAARKAAR